MANDKVQALTDEDKMPFGQYTGRKMQDVPASYLDWMRDQHELLLKYPRVAKYISNNAALIDDELRVAGRI